MAGSFNLGIIHSKLQLSTKDFDAALNKAKDSAKQAQSAIRGVGSASDKAKIKVNLLGKAMKMLGQTFKSIITYKIGSMILRGIGAAIGQAAQFEQQMKNVQAVLQGTVKGTGALAGQMKKLEKTARQVGATTVFTASQVASGMEELVRSGKSAAEVTAMIADVTNLAIVGQISMHEAARTVVNTLNQYGKAADQAGMLVDKLTHIAQTSKTNIKDLGTALRFAGTEANVFGISLNESLAAIGALSNAGLEASRAGTSLRRVIVGLHKDTKKGRGILQKYHLTYDDINTSITGGLIPSMKKLRDAGVTTEDMLQLFNIRGVASAEIFARAVDSLQATSDALDNVRGTSKKAADTMRDTLKGAWKEFSAAVKELNIQLSKYFIPALKAIVKFSTKVVRAIGNITEEGKKLTKKQKLVNDMIRSFVFALITAIGIMIGPWVGATFTAMMSAIGLAGGIGTITGALWGMLAALAANPLGLLLIGLAAAIPHAIALGKEIANVLWSTEQLARTHSKRSDRPMQDLLRKKMAAGTLQAHEIDTIRDIDKRQYGFTEEMRAMNPEMFAKLDAERLKKKKDAAKKGKPGRPKVEPGGGGGQSDEDAKARKAFNAYNREINRRNKLLDHGLKISKEQQKTTLAEYELTLADMTAEEKAVAMEQKKFELADEMLKKEQEVVNKKIENAKLLLAEAQRLGQEEGQKRVEALLTTLGFDLEILEAKRKTLATTHEINAAETKRAALLKEIADAEKKAADAASHEKTKAELDFEIDKQGMIQRGMSDDSITQAEFDHKRNMLRIDQERLTTALKLNQAHLQNKDIVGQARENIEANVRSQQRELEILGKKQQLLAAEELTFQMQDQLTMAQDFADAWSGSFQSILDQIQAGKIDLVGTLEELSNKLINDSMKPFFDDVNAMLKETFMKMGKGMGAGVMVGLGIAMKAVSSFLNRQKAEVESLADDAEQSIVENERVRGVVAGDSQIAIGKIGENLQQAFRPTNEILRSIDANTAKLAGGTTAGAGTEDTFDTDSQTQGGFAMQSIGGARV